MKCVNSLEYQEADILHLSTEKIFLIEIYHLQKGNCYLSVIRDLYDNSIVSYKLSKDMTVKLVLDTIQTKTKLTPLELRNQFLA